MCVCAFQALLDFQELRVLYLHGNCIRSLSDVDKLGKLPNLHTITLHGNPIESRQIYRWRHRFYAVVRSQGPTISCYRWLCQMGTIDECRKQL